MAVSERIPWMNPVRYWKTSFESQPRIKPEWNIPNEVILELPNAQLRYFESKNHSSQNPTLIVAPQSGCDAIIVKPVVETALEQGRPVYVVDWKSATEARRNEGINDTAKATDASVDKILEKGYKPTLVGMSEGGIEVVIEASRQPEKVKHAIVIGSPVYFNVGNSMLRHITGSVPLIFLKMANMYYRGNIRGESLTWGFKLFDDSSSTIEHFADVPESFHYEITDNFQHDKLIKGNLNVLGEYVDLSDATCYLTFIAGTKDRIVDPEQMSAALPYFKNAKGVRMLTVDKGHIDSFASPEAQLLLGGLLEEDAALSSQ